ncbi:MAG: flagellar hook-associated protein FlgL [Chlorobia bacterium]|nr:flagellar hook-associated protein FlgL [Fimbriimonadaceae bacterium]
MRISTAYQFESYTSDIRLAQERMAIAGRQVSTGKRLEKPSDDPLGTSRMLTMRSYKAATEQYSKNLQVAKGVLGYTEDSLGSLHDGVKRAYALAVQGANSATDQTGRNAMAQEITEIQSRLVQIANTRGPSGQFIFAGQDNGSTPYIVSGATITFNGDGNPVLVEVSPSETMQVNSLGEPMFSDIYNKLETLKNNLLGGNVGAISGVSITDMQTAMTNINAERGQVGAKLRQVDEYNNQYTRRVDDLTQGISDIEEVDVSQAIMSYQLAQTAYEAALRVASQGYQLSLMDFIQG